MLVPRIILQNYLVLMSLKIARITGQLYVIIKALNAILKSFQNYDAWGLKSSKLVNQYRAVNV